VFLCEILCKCICWLIIKVKLLVNFWISTRKATRRKSNCLDDIISSDVQNKALEQLERLIQMNNETAMFLPS